MKALEPDLTLIDAESQTSATLPADARIGQTIDGRYLIEKVIGQGGMGVVYKGVHEALGKLIAIKVLKPDVSKDEKVIARFKREARSASAIGSPHICDVSDFGRLEDGSTYFVMEMLDGPPLSKSMKVGAPMEIARILKIGSQLCDALGAAHAAQIVHRDLKPDNVHLVKHGSDDEFVKVLDFGIAKVATTTETKLTQAGQVFGTPHYMSPEQCAGHEVDHRTDIYALGVMMYEMACGRLPFDADNLMGLLTKHVYEQPIAPHDLPSPVDVPPAFEAVILKCLSKQPQSRYQTMGELKRDIDACATGGTPRAMMSELDRSLPIKPSGAYESMAPGPMPVRAPEKSTSWILVAIAIPLVGLAAFGLAYILLPSDTPDATVVDHDPVVPNDPDPVADPDPTADLAPTVARVVHLTTHPEGAEVFGPDGALIGNTPLDVEKPAGDVRFAYRLVLAGYLERTFAVSSTTADTARLTMTEEPAVHRGRRVPPPPPTTTQTSTTQTSTTQTTGAPLHAVPPPREGLSLDDLHQAPLPPSSHKSR